MFAELRMITTTQPLNFQQLKKIRLRKPLDAGPKWKGVPHYLRVETLWNALSGRGWWTSNTFHYALSRDKADLAAAMQVGLPDLKCNYGQWYIGMVSSNARRYGLTLYTGLKEVDGYVVSEEIYIGRSSAQDHARFDQALKDAEGAFYSMDRVMEKLQRTRLTLKQMDALIVKLGRHRILPWSRLGDVSEEAVYVEGGTSALDFLLAVSRTLDRSPPFHQMRLRLAAYKLVADIK